MSNEIRDSLTVVAVLREAIERSKSIGGSHATG
jgi:hypothetical protein